MNQKVRVRPASETDVLIVPDLETRSDQTYLRLENFAAILGRPNFRATSLSQLEPGFRLFIAETDAPIGFSWTEPVDDCAFIVQIAVVPEAQGCGAGTALLDATLATARQDKWRGVTLATFLDVPWNAPYYARRGFRLLEQHDLGPQLATRFEQDRADWSAFGQRVLMGNFF